jgi:hypothetical protein
MGNLLLAAPLVETMVSRGYTTKENRASFISWYCSMHLFIYGGQTIITYIFVHIFFLFARILFYCCSHNDHQQFGNFIGLHAGYGYVGTKSVGCLE